MTPLAIDLFCGLGSGQPELFLSADTAVKQFVARRTENPNHVPLSIGDNSPRAISFVVWLMRYLKDSVFSARFARARNIRIPAPQPSDNTVLERSARIVGFDSLRISAHENAPLRPSGLTCTFLRAIATISAWGRNCEMLSTPKAIASAFRHIELFKPASTPSTGCTWLTAISFIWPLSLETSAAIRTK